MHTPSRYRPDIDGLRAIAVSAVVLYHAFPTIFRGGFVGVDVFFVISGFLISGIIFSGLEAGEFSFATFYSRRVRRIFPALSLVLAFCLAYGFLVLLPSEFADLGRDIAAGAGFVSNLLLWHEAGYFDRAATAKPLLHLWSLGVEEQFYIFWPAALWLIHRLRWRPMLPVAAIAVVSFVLNIALSTGDPTADFYSPLTRFWELAAGAMLAWAELHPPSWWPRLPRDFAAGVALVLILGSALVLNAQMRFPGWLALLPAGGAVLLIAAGPAARINRAVLSNNIAVFIGLISYPLYLWHWPLISYATIIGRGRAPKPGIALLLVAVSVGLAWLTYELVEKPLRFGGRGRRTAALAGIMVVIAVLGLTTSFEHGFAGRYADLPDLNIAKVNGAIRDGIFKPTPDMRVRIVNKIYISQIGAGAGAVLFTGDSVLYQYGPRVQELFTQGRLRERVYFVTGASCAPVPGVIKTGLFAYCTAMPGITAQLLASTPIQTVVIGAFWQGYPPDGAIYANLETEVRGLVATHHQVFLVLAVPWDARFDPMQMVRRSLFGFSMAPDVLGGVPVASLVAANAAVNARLTEIARETGAGTIDPLPSVCGGGAVCGAFFGDGEPKFADDKHLRPVFVKDYVTCFDGLLTK